MTREQFYRSFKNFEKIIIFDDWLGRPQALVDLLPHRGLAEARTFSLYRVVLSDYWELGEQPIHQYYPHTAYNHESGVNGAEYESFRADYPACLFFPPGRSFLKHH